MFQITKKTAAALVISALAMVVSFAESAQAVPTIRLGQTSGLANYSQLVDFERNFNRNTVITNQFADQGVTFVSGDRTAVRFDVCGNNSWNDNVGLSGHTVSNLPTSCRPNNTIDRFSVKFDANVSAASFGYYLYNSNHLSRQTISTLLNGVVNSTYSVLVTGRGFAVISGGTFNEIRFVDGAANDYATIDNLTFLYAASGVPTPGTLALFGLGLLGMVVMYRKRNAK